MSYSDRLRKPRGNPYECGLGKVLETEGREKYEEILDAMFLIDADPLSRTYGRLHPIPALIELFWDEYGWGEFFFRRHRHGTCKACLMRDSRTETS